jgi:hypothetical protein
MTFFGGEVFPDVARLDKTVLPRTGDWQRGVPDMVFSPGTRTATHHQSHPNPSGLGRSASRNSQSTAGASSTA